MASELHAKAQRAAEWLKSGGWDVRHRDERWTAYSPGYGTEDYSLPYDDFRGSGRLLIAFCEDQGWQDSQSLAVDNADDNSQELTGHASEPQEKVEADGVEWETKTEEATLGTLDLLVSLDDLGQGYTWAIWDNDKAPTFQCSGTAPTRSEARRQSVEAARGMV